MTGTVLDALAAYARECVEEKGRKLLLAELKRQLGEREAPSGFPFETAFREPGLSVITEAKKASPLKDVITEYFPYLGIAKACEAAGASCISVLTEPKQFLGDDRYLHEIAVAVSLSCIRRDFTVDPYFIYRTRGLGALAVLLIRALLGRSELEEYLGTTEELGLSAPAEAHDEERVGRTVEVRARLIGVNNRDSKSFSINMENSPRFHAATLDNCIFIAKSGVWTPTGIQTLQTIGANGILIGEVLTRAENKVELLQALRKGYKKA